MKKLGNMFAGIFAAAFMITSCAAPSTGSGTALPERGVDYSLAKVGDIILTDGTICKPEDFAAPKTAVAVIVREATDVDDVLGIALFEKTGLEYCTEGYLLDHSGGSMSTTIRKNTAGTDYYYGNGTSKWNNSEKMKSLLDGYLDNTNLNPRQYIDKLPAWNYCLNYGTTKGYTGQFASGWYLPTLYELDHISRLVKNTSENPNLIPQSVIKAGGTQPVISGHYYMSSNVDSNEYIGLCMLGTLVKTNAGGNYIYPTVKRNATSKTADGTYSAGNVRTRAVYHFKNDANTVAAPTFSAKSGSQVTAVKVYTITSGATINYRINNGSWTTCTSGTSIEINGNPTIEAYTSMAGLRNSSTVSASYKRPVY